MAKMLILSFLMLFFAKQIPAASDCHSAVAPKSLSASAAFEQAAKEPQFQEFLQAYDKKAFAVVKQLSLKKEDTAIEIQKWFNEIKADNLSVMEFTTLQLALRADYLKEAISPELKSEMLKNLEKNWFKYTGQKLQGEKILNKAFPSSVLSTQDVRIQRFNQLATKMNSQTLEIEPGILGKIINKMAPIGLLAFGLSATGGDILTGALIGYSVSLAAEYWIHRWVMHSGKSKDKLPWYINLNEATSTSMLDLARLHFGHHQELTPNDYKRREGSHDLNSPYVKEELTPKLVDNGMTPERVESFVVETRHATIMEKRGWKTATFGMAIPSAVTSYFVTGDPIVAPMTAALMAYAFIVHVNYVHPMMHPVEGQASIKDKFDKWFSETDYFRYIARYHFMHHSKPNTNFNVLPLGYDSLMSSESYLHLARLVKMMEQDLIY